MALHRALLLLSLHSLNCFSLSRIALPQHVLLLLSPYFEIVALLLHLPFAELMLTNFAISDFSKFPLAIHVLWRGLVRDLMIQCRSHGIWMGWRWCCVVLCLLILKTLCQISDRKTMAARCAWVVERLGRRRKYGRSLKLPRSPISI